MFIEASLPSRFQNERDRFPAKLPMKEMRTRFGMCFLCASLTERAKSLSGKGGDSIEREELKWGTGATDGREEATKWGRWFVLWAAWERCVHHLVRGSRQEEEGGGGAVEACDVSSPLRPQHRRQRQVAPGQSPLGPLRRSAAASCELEWSRLRRKHQRRRSRFSCRSLVCGSDFDARKVCRPLADCHHRRFPYARNSPTGIE